MSIALVVTRGYGNGTFSGTIPFVTTRGYSIGEDLGPWTVQTDTATSYSVQTDASTTWTEQTDDSTTWTVT